MNRDPEGSSEERYERQDESPLQWLEFRNYNCRNRNRPWHRRPCLSAKVLARGKRLSVVVAHNKARL
jgi:hypothetical protein